jgi:hypothetical protein
MQPTSAFRVEGCVAPPAAGGRRNVGWCRAGKSLAADAQVVRQHASPSQVERPHDQGDCWNDHVHRWIRRGPDWRRGSAVCDLATLKDTEPLREDIANTGAVVVVTHTPPSRHPKETGRQTLTFVTDDIESAITQVQTAARSRQVTVRARQTNRPQLMGIVVMCASHKHPSHTVGRNPGVTRPLRRSRTH